MVAGEKKILQNAAKHVEMELKHKWNIVTIHRRLMMVTYVCVKEARLRFTATRKERKHRDHAMSIHVQVLMSWPIFWNFELWNA